MSKRDTLSPESPAVFSPVNKMISHRLLQIGFLLIGVLLFVWAFSSSLFRDAEGFWDGRISLPITLGVASLILGFSVKNRATKFFYWLVLALVGQAAALQLIVAGSALRYQHYKPFETQPWLLLFILFQTVLVIWGIKNRFSEIWGWLQGIFKTWQLAGIAALFFFSSATVSAQPSFFIFELFFAAFIQTLNLGNIALVVLALPEETLTGWKSRIERIFGLPTLADKSQVGKLDRFAVITAVWVIILAAVLNTFSYQQHPHVTDEFAYIYHARYLASGVLSTPAPAVPEAFEVYLMLVDGDVWFPSPPPGWPAVLAIGVFLGAGWLVNPFLAGLNILVIYLLLQELFSRRLARVAIFLLAFSPWYVFMGMNYMTHMFTLTCALLATLGVVWARRMNKAVWAWLGGIALGMIGVIRPLEAVAMAALLGLWSIGIGGKRLKVSAIAGLVLGAMLVGGTALLYNQALTGDPTLFPIMAYTNQYFGSNANAMGFGPDRGMGWAIDPYPGHSPRDAIINASLNTFMLNIDLFGWSIGSLLLAGIFVFAGKIRRNDYCMLAVIGIIFGLHFFYYFSGGPDFGARYWFLMILPLVVLTVRGIQYLEEKFSESAVSTDGSARVMVFILLLSLMAFVNFFPWRAIDKYYHFRGMRPDIRYLAEEYEFGRSLVLVRGVGDPDYASAANYNPVDIQDNPQNSDVADDPIYAWDRSSEIRSQVVHAYADRPIWIIEGPSITKSGYKVIAGPLMAEDLLDTP